MLIDVVIIIATFSLALALLCLVLRIDYETIEQWIEDKKDWQREQWEHEENKKYADNVVVGHWIRHSNLNGPAEWECSVCHGIQYGDDYSRHYCQVCGAKMDSLWDKEGVG